MSQVASRKDSRRTRRRPLSKNLHKKQYAAGSSKESLGISKESFGRDAEASQTRGRNDAAAIVLEKHRKNLEKANEDLQKMFCEMHILLEGKEVLEEWKESSKQSLESLRRENQVLGLPINGKVRYPAFQFGKDGKPYSRIQEVLAAIPRELTDWERAYWLVSPNDLLGWKTPISAIESDDASVVAAAKHAGSLPVG